MSTTTPVNAFQIPVLSDAPDIETAIHPFANAVDTRVVSRHASASARTTAIPSPATGAVSHLLDTGAVEYYNGSAWRPLTSLWVAYTPVISSSGGGATVGNGTIVGRWRRMADTVTARVTLTWGSTTTFGTGNPSFTLPVTALTNQSSGSAVLQDVSANAFAAACVIDTVLTTVAPLSSAGVITNTVPFTWTTGDVVRLEVTYEV